MSEEIFNKWKDVASRGTIEERIVKELYEEEGKSLLDTFQGENDLSQGWSSTFNLTKDVLINELKSNYYNKKALILDIGCGATPRLFLSLSNYNNKYVYIGGDISPTKLSIFNKLADNKPLMHKNNLNLVNLDSKLIPFKDNSFDFIICDDTLEHLTEPIKGLCEIRRVLKEEGVAIISTPNKNRPDVFLRKAIDLIQFKKENNKKYYMAISHLNEFTHSEFRKLLKKIGISVKKSYCLDYPFSLSEIKKAGYFSKIPNFLLKFPYSFLNLIIKKLKIEFLSTHIFLICSKNKK